MVLAAEDELRMRALLQNSSVINFQSKAFNDARFLLLILIPSLIFQHAEGMERVEP